MQGGGVGGDLEEDVDLIDGVGGPDLFWNFGGLEVCDGGFVDRCLSQEEVDEASYGRDFSGSGSGLKAGNICGEPFSHDLS